MEKSKKQDVAKDVPEHSVGKVVALEVEKNHSYQISDQGQDWDMDWGSDGQCQATKADEEAENGHADNEKGWSKNSFEDVVDEILDASGKRLREEAGVGSVFEGQNVVPDVVPEDNLLKMNVLYLNVKFTNVIC